jgi:hypothetical protein
MTPGRAAAVHGLALVTICLAVVYLAGRPPAPEPAGAPPAVFSAERAMAVVRAIAERPHPSGSADHARVRAYLVGAIEALGLEAEIQEATGVSTRYPVAARIANVLTRLPGRGNTGLAVLFVAHYDGVAAGPAAGDDAAGVAALIEMLRALKSGPPLQHDVIVLLTDSEEGGLTGAAAFAREHRWARDVQVVANFEGRGSGGPSQLFETAAGNLDVVRVFSRSPAATGTSLAVTVYRNLPNDTDLSELFVLDQPALNFSFIDGLEHYHTRLDDVAHLDPGSVQHHGVHALALARAFGDGPLPRPRTEDAVFFTVPGLGMFAYSERLAVPLAIGGTVLVLLAAVLVRRRETHWLRSVILGFIGTVVSTGLAGAAAYAFGRLLPRVADAPLGSGWFMPRGLYTAAVVLVALSFVSGCWALVRRWANPGGAHVGALLVWTVAAVVAGRMLPGASFLFAWPLVASAVAALVTLVVRSAAARQAAHWISGLAVAAIVVPLVYGIATMAFAMSGPAALVAGLFTAFPAWLLPSALDGLRGARRWVTPLVMFASALACFASATVVHRNTVSTRVEPSMLVYAFDVDTPGAWIGGPLEFARPGSWTARVLGPSAKVARALPPGSPDAAPAWLTRSIAGETIVMAPAPRITLDTPEIDVVADSRGLDGKRRLDLRVRPGRDTYTFRLRAIEGDVISAEVDGRAIDTSRYRAPSRQWNLGYIAPSDGGVRLALVVPGDRPLTLALVARVLGLPDALRASLGIPERPKNVVPIHGGDQTVVHRAFRF